MEEDGGKEGGRGRGRDAAMRLSPSFPTTTLSSIWPPTPAVWFVDKWVGEVSVSAPRRERRSSLLPGIIARRCGGTTLASEGERVGGVRQGGGGGWGEGGRRSRSQGGNARHDGKSNPLSGGRQGERLTDERDQRKTEREREREEREHPKARQIRGGHHRKQWQWERRGRREGSKTEEKEAGKGGGGGAEMERGKGRRGRRWYTLSYISPKGNFHPTHKGQEQGRVVLRKVWIVCLCAYVCVFVETCWFCRRLVAEWQGQGGGVAARNLNMEF